MRGLGDRVHFFRVLKGVLLAAGFGSMKALLGEAQRYQKEKSFVNASGNPFRIRPNPCVGEVALLCWCRSPPDPPGLR